VLFVLVEDLEAGPVKQATLEASTQLLAHVTAAGEKI
jgi:hypothetical protein